MNIVCSSNKKYHVVKNRSYLCGTNVNEVDENDILSRCKFGFEIDCKLCLELLGGKDYG